jgi:hypothetical protein
MFAFASDAAPRPVLAAVDQARADGVVEDVLDRVLVVVLVVDDPRGEALAEECALALEAGVVLSGVVALVPLDRGREVFDPPVDDRVVVRAHQAVGVKSEVPALGGLCQQRDEGSIVVPVAEQPGLVHGVRRQVEIAVRQLSAQEAGHASTLRRRCALARRPTHFLSTFDPPSRPTPSVRHSSWPAGPRR